MAANSKIEWCDDTVNFWHGCTQVSPGCDHCYAKELLSDRFGIVAWNGPPVERVAAAAAELKAINRRAQREGCPRFVFINSVSDTFDKLASRAWRARLFDAIDAAPDVVALILTKRIGNAEEMGAREAHPWPRNAWLGATVVNQEEADRDVQKLLAAKAALQIPRAFLSIEPMLGPMHIDRLDYLGSPLPQLDWIICGGESGRNARPMHPDWARSLRDQCAASGVPFHFKQVGEWAARPCAPSGQRANASARLIDGVWFERVGKKAAGRLLDGVEHNGRPPS